MDELVRAFSTFIARDVIYILGGSTILIAMLYFAYAIAPSDIQAACPNSLTSWLEKLPATAQTFLVAFGLGIAWILGYVAQDGLSLTRLVTTAPMPRKPRVVRWLYERLVGEIWNEIAQQEFGDATLEVDERAAPRSVAKLERIITLKHIGSTIGSCWLIAAVLVIAGSAMHRWEGLSSWFGLAMLLISLILIALGHVKNLQQQRTTILLSAWLKQNKPKPDKPS